MKGFIYYAQVDAIKNALFIEDLREEAKKIGIQLQLIIDDETPDEDADFILFRGRDFKLAKKFEAEGWTVINRSEVNRIANHKLRTYELSVLLGIPAVPTKKIRLAEDIQSYPTIIKTVDGHGGNEVFLISKPEKTENILKKYENRELIAQPYIESGARDIRVFIIGDEIIGAVKRTGTDDFKSNYTLGGTVEKFTLSPAQEKDALTIAKALRSDYIGIDFLLLPDGRWLLNEIEDPVGARSLYLTHDFSVAKKLMGYVKQKYIIQSSAHMIIS